VYSITGSRNNIFFVLKKHPEQPDILVAQVKDEVSQVSSPESSLPFAIASASH
jgi:hypothetical protein